MDDPTRDGDLIDRIYEAAVVSELWPTVLQDIARTVTAEGGLLVGRRSTSWLGWCVSPEHEATVSDYLRSDAASRSQSTARLLAANRAGYVGDHELFTRDEYLADPCMTEFGLPQDLNHAAATAIQTPREDLAIIQVQRRAGAPPFSSSDLRRLDAFRPHLARAAMLSARWRLAQLQAAAHALEQVGLPAAVIDATGRVLAANALIQSRPLQVVWRSDNRLAFTDLAATKMFQSAAGRLDLPDGGGSRSFPMRGPDDDELAVAHVIPIKGEARDLFGRGLGFVVLTASNGRQRQDLSLLRALFDLTPAEARVAADMLAGVDIDRIASCQGVGRETIRTQAKAVLAKSGCHRQAEFIAKVLPLHRLV